MQISSGLSTLIIICYILLPSQTMKVVPSNRRSDESMDSNAKEVTTTTMSTTTSPTKPSVEATPGRPTTASVTAKPWWTGVPTRLIGKRTLVAGSSDHLPVHTLTFEIPDATQYDDDDVFRNSGGKVIPHSQIRLDMGDIVKMVIPGYKPKSYSVSALRCSSSSKQQQQQQHQQPVPVNNEFDVTFKVYPNGRASGYLNRLKVGDTIHSFGMKKTKTRNPGSTIGIIAYGVGITDALPVAMAELEKGDANNVTLLWASRTMGDTFWNIELEELKRRYPQRFRLVYVLSREYRKGCYHGRINEQLIHDLFDGSPDCRFLSVGTKEMMYQTDIMLSKVGYPQPHHALLQDSIKSSVRKK